MNKYKQLSKKIGKTAVVSFAVVAVTGGIFGGISMYAGNVEKMKKDAESKLAEDKSKIASYNSQMDQSGEAEKRFALIQETRNSTNYTGNLEALTEWWRNTKAHYRFDNDTKLLKGAGEGPSEKDTLKDLPYNVIIRPRMKVDSIGAISDMHIFSFVEDLRRSSPGIARIELMEVKRINPQSDLDAAATDKIRSGVMPLLVDGRVEFGWIGITPKDNKDPKAASAQAVP